MVHSNEPAPVFSPCRLPCAQQAKFILPSICMLSTNLHYWRLQAWMQALILSLCAECMKNEIRFQLTQNNRRLEIFLCAQRAAEQPGSQMGPWGSTRGSLQGQHGLCWADCKIGTGVMCEGYKCKHSQRKWVTIPTLLLTHCASPRILETVAKSWPLSVFSSQNKQMLPWQFLAGFCCDLPLKRAWCRVSMPVTETGSVLGLTVPGRSTFHSFRLIYRLL